MRERLKHGIRGGHRSPLPWLRERGGDLLAGLILVGLGTFFLVESFDYRMGTASAMGPGYFPRVLSALLILFGIGVAVAESLGKPPEPLPDFQFRSVLLVLGAIAAFAVTVERFGVVPAVTLAVLLSGRSDRTNGFVTLLILAASVSALIWLVFIVGLGLPVGAFR